MNDVVIRLEELLPLMGERQAMRAGTIHKIECVLADIDSMDDVRVIKRLDKA